MEYNIDAFITRLMELMTISVPYEQPTDYEKRHKKRNGARLKDLFDPTKNVISVNFDTRVFDVGGPMAEEIMPHYHILENAPVIRKSGKGTKKSKGSQDLIERVGNRDYEKVSFNGKTYTKEYARNVRGNRLKLNKMTFHITDTSGNTYLVNREANEYKNYHYQYIEKALDSGILDQLAVEFSMTRKRTQSTGLQEEYESQLAEEYNSNVEDILGILDSFSESEEEDYE